MKVSFSLNQVAQIKLNAERYSAAYDVVRSYLGIPVGECFTVFDFIDAWTLGEHFTVVSDGFNTKHIYIRGTEYDFDIVLHAARCEVCYINVGMAFNSPTFNVNAAARLVKHYKTMIDSTEW